MKESVEHREILSFSGRDEFDATVKRELEFACLLVFLSRFVILTFTTTILVFNWYAMSANMEMRFKLAVLILMIYLAVYFVFSEYIIHRHRTTLRWLLKARRPETSRPPHAEGSES